MSTARFASLKSKITNITTNLSEKVVLPEKLKGTVVERWSVYWKSLVNDYSEVAKGVVQTAKEKPLRSSILAATGLSAYYSAKNNPDEQSLMAHIRSWNNQMMLVHESSQRASSSEYLKLLERSMNEGTLRTLNLGVLTLVWLHDFSKELCTYRAVCSFLQPEYSTFHERIIDVGFLNRWWNLERKMIDYDIAEEEQ